MLLIDGQSRLGRFEKMQIKTFSWIYSVIFQSRHVVTSRYCFAHFQKWKCSGLVLNATRPWPDNVNRSTGSRVQTIPRAVASSFHVALSLLNLPIGFVGAFQETEDSCHVLPGGLFKVRLLLIIQLQQRLYDGLVGGHSTPDQLRAEHLVFILP